MSLKNKTIGMVFINNPEIKGCFKYQLIKIKSNYNATFIPIVKDDYFNINIDKFTKITKNKPFFYNKGIILEKDIKKLDILILVGCSDNIINKLLNRKFDNNILKIVKFSRINRIPIVIGINIKKLNNLDLNKIESLYKQKEYFFIPFKITNPITNPDKVSFDSNLFVRTISLATENIQIKPLISTL